MRSCLSLIYIATRHEPHHLQIFTSTPAIIHSRELSQSFRDEQVFRERPLIVNPLNVAAETGGTGH
jgi:hypothetical protein